jgi:hypothetical protein
MKSIELSAVEALAPHLQSGELEPLVVTKDGQTVAAVVPTNDADVEDLLLSVNAKFQAILNQSQRRMQEEGVVPASDVRKRLGLNSN